MSEVSAAGGIGEDAGRQAPYGRLSARMALQLAAPHTWPAAILPALVAVAAAAATRGGLSVTMAFTLLAICGATQRGSYREVMMVGLVGPLLALACVIVLGKLFGAF